MLTSLLTIVVLTAFLPQNKDFSKLWKKVETFQKKGMPKSAVKIVDEIYTAADNEQNSSQKLKALIYKAALTASYEENYLLKSVSVFEKEADLSQTPEKQILYSLTAQLYQAYFTRNRYKIVQRQPLAEPGINPETWDAVQFNKKIKNYYLKSLQPQDALKAVSLNDFKAILKLADSSSLKYRSTLYDLLASRAVSYFSSVNYKAFDMEQHSALLSDSLMVPAEKFVKLSIEPTSNTNQILNIYQRLLKLHLNDNNPVILVDLDLARISFIASKYAVQKSTELTLLKDMYRRYKAHEVSVRIAMTLANLYQQQGALYHPENSSDTISKSAFVKARIVCKEALHLHPGAPFVNNCKNIIASIERPSVAIKTEKQLLPGKPFLSMVDFKNITKLYFKIVRVNFEKVALNPDNNIRYWIKNEKYLSAPGVKNWEINLTDTKDYQHHATEIKVEGLPLGTYFLYVSSQKDFKNAKHLGCNVINVTNLSFINKNNDGAIEFLVQNRRTGEGLKGVKGEVFRIRYHHGKNTVEKAGSFVTGDKGFSETAFTKNWGYNSIVRLIKGSDTLYRTSYFDGYRSGTARPTVNIHLFTDRSLYRPGQTLYFKGIVVQNENRKFTTLKNYKTKVTLKNAQYKKVVSIDVKSNEYGSFSGSFVIPTGSMNGNWQLITDKGRVGISVEEYKRPTFSVEFDTLSGSYKYNDKITITGKVNYFSGAPVSGAKVVLRVTRRNYFPMPLRWYPPQPSPETEIARGTAVVDENGNFSFSFKAVPNQNGDASQFTVYADVTDITGEVHSGNTTLKISRRELWIVFDKTTKVNLNMNPEIAISAGNTAGKPLPVSGILKIYVLRQPHRVFVDRYWPEPDIYTLDKEEYRKLFPQYAYKKENQSEQWNKKLIVSKELSWKGDTTLSGTLIRTLKPGYYKFVFTAKDQSGQPVSDSLTTLIFNSNSKKQVANKPFWYYLSKEKAEPGETVLLVVASAEKNTKIYYELTVKNKVVAERWIKAGRKQVVVPITIKEAWRGGVQINLVAVKNNRRYSLAKRITVPFTNKKLTIRLQTFRDHLTPGKKETWSVKISGYKKDVVASELLAAMYDKSLDRIKDHSWNFDLFHQYNFFAGWMAKPFSVSGFLNIKDAAPKYFSEEVIHYPQINWFGMPMAGNNEGIYNVVGLAAGRERMNKSIQMDVVDDIDTDDDVVKTGPVAQQQTELFSENKSSNEPTVTRSDFRETAFFYPQLHTDSTGSVSFDFTTPDALTQWKLMMLAHTADLSSGIKTLSFKAYKALMVMPNVPRFVRQGDRLMFSARVTNFSHKKQKVDVKINFFDPVTNKKLPLISTVMSTQKQTVLKAGESTKVSWFITIPDTINLLAYHLEAASKTFSDAEERVIPVLTNRVLVTETMPMYVNAHGHKKYRFKKLINQQKTGSLSTLKNFNYTLEFTSNPAWYAIQALPYLSRPANESASNLFRAFYANALSGWIVNSNPKIKAVFNSWKTNTPDTFLSALQKNKELKNTVLEETPWVLEAENESAQKRNLALLFDLNNLKNQQQTTLNKLQMMQLGSGAWPWFKGMHDDRYTTQQIVIGLAKLYDKGVVSLQDHGIKRMLRKAISYLDRKISEDYNRLLKQSGIKLNKKHITSTQIQYLYARTLLLKDFDISKKNKKAFDYYLGQTKKYWLKENNYLQAMIAIILYENGNRNQAEAVLRSLEERSLYSDELGMYWRNRQGWYWYQAPVETQAMIIEAFSRLNYNPQNLYKMKIWLLKQKQTQRWPTSSATAEAVYALLMTGNGSLLNETKPVVVKLDGKPLVLNNEEPKPEAGSGYFKKSWPPSGIKSGMGNIEVSNPNKHITWGAAYWQYFEDIDKVSAAKSPLYVEKKLYLEKQTENGPVLENTDGKKLRTGDKLVVRLIIHTDRDMEFVELKDVRATGMEIIQQLSGYGHSGGLNYYRNNKDASTSYFFRYLNKGTYVLEYPVHLTQQGVFRLGLATIQCLYAPAFAAHSQGRRIEIEQ